MCTIKVVAKSLILVLHLRTTDIHKVLSRIRDAGLTVGLKKCHFGGREVSFLGYIVTEAGIRPDPAKVEAVRSFKLPKTLSELRSFLGLTGQFRKFIRHYGDIVRPLQYLTRNEAHGLWTTGQMWTSERILAFEAVKLAVTEDVMLAHPRFDRPLLMVCDAKETVIHSPRRMGRIARRKTPSRVRSNRAFGLRLWFENEAAPRPRSAVYHSCAETHRSWISVIMGVDGESGSLAGVVVMF